MSCNIKNIRNKGEISLLGIQLKEIYKSEEKATEMYDYFVSQPFIERFGDWINEDLDSYRVLENKEPRLTNNSSGIWFWTDKDGYRIPLEVERFEKLGALGDKVNTVNEITNQIAFAIYKKHFQKDLSNLDTLNFNLKEEVTAFFDQVIKDNPEEKEFVETLYRPYTDDFVETTKIFFSERGLNYSEGDIVHKSEGAIKQQPSFYRDQKERAATNTKLALSFLTRVDKKGDPVVGDYLPGNKLMDFNEVYNELQILLSNIPSVLLEGKATNVLDEMQNRIVKRASSKKYLIELLDNLNNTSSKYKKIEFAQTFNLVKNVVNVSEFKGRPGRRVFSYINGGESSTKASQVIKEWNKEFKSKFVSQTLQGKFSVNLESLENIFNDYFMEGNENTNLRIMMREFRINRDDATFKVFRDRYIDFLDSLGIEASQEALDFLMYNDDVAQDKFANTLEIINNQIDGWLRLFSDKKNKFNKSKFQKVISKNNKYNNPFKEQTSFVALARAQAVFENDLTDNTARIGNKELWLYSLPTHIQNKIDIYKFNKKELETLATIPYHKRSAWINYLLGIDEVTKEVNETLSKQRLKQLRLELRGTFQEHKKSTQGTDNDTTKKGDFIINDFNQVLRVLPTAEGYVHKPSYISPTPADKGREFMLVIDYFKRTHGNINEDGEFEFDGLDYFVDAFTDEYDRSLKVWDDIKTAEETDDYSNLKLNHHLDSKGNLVELLYKIGGKYYTKPFKTYQAAEEFKPHVERPIGVRYIGAGLKSQFFPSINNLPTTERAALYNRDNSPVLTMEEFKGKLTVTQLETVIPLIKQAIEARVLNYKSLMETNKLITKKDGNLNIDLNVWNSYKNNITEMASDYVINSMISRMEYARLFTGDLSYYKSMVDYFKRVPETYIDGIQPIVGITENDHLFNVSVIESSIIQSEILDKLPKHLKHYYKDIDQNDAQAYITPERWRFLNERLAKWSEKHEAVYNKIMKNPDVILTEDEVKLIQAQPLKGVYYDIQNGEPVYLKYSQAVLMPNLVKGTQLEEVLQRMYDSGTDELVTVSGIKVGTTTPNKILDKDGSVLKDKFNTFQADNRHWRLQQDLPTKGLHATLLGTQLQKNILDTLAFNEDEELYPTITDPETGEVLEKGITKLEMRSQINEVLSYLSDIGMQHLVGEFGIKVKKDADGNLAKDADGNLITDYKIEDLSTFYKPVIRELETKRGALNVIDALKKELTPYSIPQNKNKIIQTIFSIVRKNVVKLKTEGGGFIQMSNYLLGMEKAKEKGIYMLEDIDNLKMPEVITQENGRKLVKPGQVFLPHSAIARVIPNYRKMDRKELMKIVDKRLFDIVGYRIPNQALASTDALQIVGILPETMGDMVVTYGEITKKTGSDFDIDKLYVMSPSYNTTYSKATYRTAKEFLRKKFEGRTHDEFFNDINDLLHDDVEITEEELNDLIFTDLKKGVDSKKDLVLQETLNDVITNVLFNPEEELGKEYRRTYDITDSVKSIDYVEFDTSLPASANTKKANQNRLLELYRMVLLAPSRYEDLVTPIDFTFFSDEVKRLNGENESTEDLVHFDPLYNITMKYDLKAGQAGIGQMSNALVDHNRSQGVGMSLNTSLIWGNKNEEGNTVLDKQYSEEEDLGEGHRKFRISHSLSALINAFVDIANENAYITKGNWGSLFNNLGTFLLRAGVHPYKVIAFIKQPILTDLVEKTSITEGKLSNKKAGEIIEEVKKEYENQLFLKLLETADGDIEAEKQHRAFIKSAKFANLEKVDLKKLRKNINKSKTGEKDSYFYYDQLVILSNYSNLINTVKKYRLSVVSSKFGETGNGIDPIQSFIIQNQISDVFTPTPKGVSLRGYEKKYVDDKLGSTFLNSFYQNTMVFINNLIEANPNIFLTSSEYNKALFNDIAMHSHKDRKYLDNENLGKLLDSELYSYYMSGLIEFEEGNEGMKDKFLELKKTSNNLLIKSIQTNIVSGLTFVGIDNSRKKTTSLKDQLTESWRDLFKTNPDVAEWLVKASFLQSGFKNNVFQMYEYIPNEWFIKKETNKYINTIYKDQHSFEDFKDQMYRHMWDNPMLVPKLKEGKRVGSAYFKLSTNHKYEVGSYKDEYTGEVVKVYPNFINVGGNLFKLIGYAQVDKMVHMHMEAEWQPRYIKTFKLGVSESEANLVEYKYNGRISKSRLKSNNLTEANKLFINDTIIPLLQDTAAVGNFIYLDSPEGAKFRMDPMDQTTIEEKLERLKMKKEVKKKLSNLGDKNTISVYWGNDENLNNTRILSNLAPREFGFEGKVYGSVEHAYQTLKSGKFDSKTYEAYRKSGVSGQKIRGEAVTKAFDNLQLMRDLVVASFVQNRDSKAAKKLLQYTDYTHPTRTVIDEAFLEGLRLARIELVSSSKDQLSLFEEKLITGEITEEC